MDVKSGREGKNITNFENPSCYAKQTYKDNPVH